jgi:hypothetical protein
MYIANNGKKLIQAVSNFQGRLFLDLPRRGNLRLGLAMAGGQ